jgi:hypothetical protein
MGANAQYATQYLLANGLGAIPGAGPLAGLAAGTGAVAGLADDDIKHKRTGDMGGWGYVPGPAQYDLMRRLIKANKDGDGESPRLTAANRSILTPGAQMLGLALLGALAGGVYKHKTHQGLGHDGQVQQGALLGALGGVGAAGLGQLAGTLGGMFGDKAKQYELDEYARGTDALDWLVPGVSQYRMLKQMRSTDR